MKNKSILLIISIVIFFTIFNSFFSFFLHSFLKNLDEIILISSLILFIFITLKSQKVKKLSLYILLVSIVLFLISLNGPNFNLINVLIQILIHLKFFIFFLIIYHVYKTDKKKLIKFFYIIVLFSFIGMFINLILQENFNTIFDLRNMYRNSLLRINSFQFNSNALSYLITIFFIYLVFQYKSIKVFTLLSIIFILINLYITTSRTPLLLYPFIFYYFISTKIKIPNFIIFFILILTSISIIFFLQNTFLLNSLNNNLSMINSGDNEQKYIRGIMIYYSIILFLEYFPIGTGAASYGSIMSEGSKVYENLGIDQLRFFRDMIGIYDCNIATILGEFGLVGVILFSILFWKLWSFIKKIHTANLNYYKVLIIFIFLIMLKGSMLMHSYTSLLFAIALNISIQTKGKQ